MVKTRYYGYEMWQKIPRNGCRINSKKCPVKEGLARTLKKGLKQSFLTDSGKVQSSEMALMNKVRERRKKEKRLGSQA